MRKHKKPVIEVGDLLVSTRSLPEKNIVYIVKIERISSFSQQDIVSYIRCVEGKPAMKGKDKRSDMMCDVNYQRYTIRKRAR